MTMYVCSHLVYFVIIADQDLHPADLGGVPVVEFLYLPEIDNGIALIIFGHAGFVEPADDEAARPRRVLHEVCLHLVPDFQLQLVCHPGGDDDLIGDCRVGKLQQCALLHVLLEQFRTEGLIYAL